MRFYLQRYLAAFHERRHWIFMALVPVALYLIVAALRLDRFAIGQDFVYAGDRPLAVADAALIADPEAFFLDPQILGQLRQRLERREHLAVPATEAELERLVHRSLRLTRLPDARLRLTYEGAGLRLGEFLVEFYGRRLVQTLVEGPARTAGDETATPSGFQAEGVIQVQGIAAPWQTERLPRAILIFLLSLLAVLLLIAVLELSDPAFKSERQIARYLDLPVLGSMPDLMEPARRFKDG